MSPGAHGPLQGGGVASSRPLDLRTTAGDVAPMRVVRALAAMLVWGALFAPYAQPLLCTAGMGEEMAMPGQHATHATANTIGDSAAASCVPLCVVAHVAPLPQAVTLVMVMDAPSAGATEPALGRSTLLATAAPPPKA